MAAVGGLAISFDIPLVRLTNGDIWSVQFVRSVNLVLAGFLIWFVARYVFNHRAALVPGREGWAVLILYGISTTLFFYAVYATPTANLVFILAFNPMFGALFGWLMLKERPKWQTFAAMAFMALGVFIIVQSGLAGGHLIGDLAALTSAAIIALSITITRASGKDMGYTSLLSAIVPTVLAAVFVWQQGGVHLEAPGWIVLNGSLVLPIAFLGLAIAPNYIPGAQVGMFYLLETIFAPIWIWLIFAETPSTQTLTGGAILLAALTAHSIWELREERRMRLAASG